MRDCYRIIPAFAKAGAILISFHSEASSYIDRTLGLIRDSSCQAGLVLKPATYLHFLDCILGKLTKLGKLLNHHEQNDGKKVRLEADGGDNIDNIDEIAMAGADIFVADSAIFGKPNYKNVIDSMRAALVG